MFKNKFNQHTPLRWKRFSRKGYALFSCIGKEVLVGTLSVVTLTYAKAEGVSTRPLMPTDSIEQSGGSLDEVEVVGSRAPLTALQSTKIVGVISRDDIHHAAAESINDVLKLVPGVDVRQRGGFGVQTDISINGGSFDQITILLNGVDISNSQTGHNASFFPVSINDIERIEVLEGAASRVFGSSAFNGAINIVTRADKQNNVRLNADAGGYGTFGGNAGITLNSKRIHNQLSGGYRQSDGGTANSGFIQRNGYYQGGFNSQYLNLNWQAGIASEDYGANTYYSASFPNQYEETRRYIVSVSGEIKGLPADIHITPTVYWHRDLDFYQLTKGAEGAVNGENYHKMDVYGASVNAYTKWALGKTAVGFDIRKEHILSTSYGELLPENEWKDIVGNNRKYDHLGERTNTNIFIEHNILLNGFTASVGLLANKNTGLDSKFRIYPGIDASYRPSDTWKLFASWNMALRMPTYTDLYTNNAAQHGDVNLKPEKNSTFKIGADYHVNGVDIVASAFHSNGKNMIDWVFMSSDDTKYQAMNIGELTNIGASIDAVIDVRELIPHSFITKITAGYAYINQTHSTAQQIYKSLYALEYLRHKVVLGVSHRIWSHLSGTWNLRWQQRMNGYTPYTKIDGKLMWDTQKYNIYVQADNITAHRYYDLGGIIQPGLWIMAGASIKFNL